MRIQGAFQIGLAKEENNTVALTIGTFLLTSSNEIKKILFFRSTKDKTRLDFCSKTGTLDEELYSHIRSTVQEKLGTKIAEFIIEIDI